MFGQALVFATRGASQIVPEARAPFDMGAARAAENPAARTWPRRRPEGPLDRVPEPRKAEEDSSKQVSVHGAQGRDPAVSASQKVKEAGRDFSYLLVVLIGIGITGGLFYTIFKELFLHPVLIRYMGKP